MAFPATVRTDIASGFPGDLALDGPTYASPVVLNGNGTPANLVIGRVMSIDKTRADPQIAVPGRLGSSYVLPGILISRGQQASYGTAAGGSLAQTMVLPEGAVAEVLHGCAGVFVTVATPAFGRPGNLVIYHTTTGVLDGLLPDNFLPEDHEVLEGAVFVRDFASSDGLAIISLTGPLSIGSPSA